MSVYVSVPMTTTWPHFGPVSQSATDTRDGQGDGSLGLGIEMIQSSPVDLRSPVSCPKSFSPSLNGPSCSQSMSKGSQTQSANLKGTAGHQALDSREKRDRASTGQAYEDADAESTPTSPAVRLTSASAERDCRESGAEEDEDIGSDGEEDDDEAAGNPEGGSVEKTAAERRAEKRKMKRFRFVKSERPNLVTIHAHVRPG